jgi:hypothetical protein
MRSRSVISRSMVARSSAVLVALASLGFSVSPVLADQYPKLNTAPVCHGITEQSDLQEGFRRVSFDECMKAEQGDREAMIKEWPTFSADDKRHCIAEATMGGESSYTDLLTCMEMSRDVREQYKQADAGDQKQTSDQAGRNDSSRRRKHSKHRHPA